MNPSEGQFKRELPPIKLRIGPKKMHPQATTNVEDTIYNNEIQGVKYLVKDAEGNPIPGKRKWRGR